MDDANTFIQVIEDPNTEFEKRCYDEKGNNICLAPKSLSLMTIRFSECLSVDIQGVLNCLINAGYKFKGIQSGHYGRKIATFKI